MSTRYATELTPERRERRVVMLIGVVALVAGMLLLLTLPVAAWLRLAALPIWLTVCLRDLRGQLQGYARVRRLRLDSGGGFLVIGPTGRRETAKLKAGSVVLSRAAWLNVEFVDGSSYGELLTGRRERCQHWHSLQLVWEQRQGVFGGTD